MNLIATNDWKDPVAVARSARVAAKVKAAGRRKHVDPTTTDREYTPAEVQFMNAMQEYKTRHNRPFPTWSEALEVLESLGYTQAPEDARTI